MHENEDGGRPGTEYDPHCLRCDIDPSQCDGWPPAGLEDAYIGIAGHKPASGIMRSAWEHGYAIACRIWDACLQWREGRLK